MSDSPHNSVSRMLSQIFSRQTHKKDETTQSIELYKDISGDVSAPIESDLEKPDDWVE